MRNAATYYAHLREQGESHEKAAAHTRQRFGISQTSLVAEIESMRGEARRFITSTQPPEPYGAISAVGEVFDSYAFVV